VHDAAHTAHDAFARGVDDMGEGSDDELNPDYRPTSTTPTASNDDRPEWQDRSHHMPERSGLWSAGLVRVAVAASKEAEVAGPASGDGRPAEAAGLGVRLTVRDVTEAATAISYVHRRRSAPPTGLIGKLMQATGVTSEEQWDLLIEVLAQVNLNL